MLSFECNSVVSQGEFTIGDGHSLRMISGGIVA